MKNIFLILFLLGLSSGASACATCMGLNPNDQYFLYIIAIFILLATGIIIFVLKTCYKYKNINNTSIEKNV